MASSIRNAPLRAEPRAPFWRPRLRLLRVFGVATTALTYVAQHAGHIIAIAWFPCVLETASRFALEWWYYTHPATMPDLLVSDDFSPPTWLTAAVPTPWAAMAWAFILSDMADRNSRRGALTMAAVRWIRFELSPPILIAAAIFSAANVADGLIRLADRGLLVAIGRANEFHMSEMFFIVWGWSAVVVRMALSALIMAWTYPIAGRVLNSRIGTDMDGAAVRRILRKNIMRVTAIFLLLSAALAGLDRLLSPAKAWLVHRITEPPWWTLPEAALTYAVDFPFSMLSIVIWAVTVGIVLTALTDAPQAPTQRAARLS